MSEYFKGDSLSFSDLLLGIFPHRFGILMASFLVAGMTFFLSHNDRNLRQGCKVAFNYPAYVPQEALRNIFDFRSMSYHNTHSKKGHQVVVFFTALGNRQCQEIFEKIGTKLKQRVKEYYLGQHKLLKEKKAKSMVIIKNSRSLRERLQSKYEGKKLAGLSLALDQEMIREELRLFGYDYDIQTFEGIKKNFESLFSSEILSFEKIPVSVFKIKVVKSLFAFILGLFFFSGLVVLKELMASFKKVQALKT